MNEQDFRNMCKDVEQAVEKAFHSPQFLDIRNKVNTTLQNTVESIQSAFESTTAGNGNAQTGNTPPSQTPPAQPVPPQPVYQYQYVRPNPIQRPVYTPKKGLAGSVSSVLLLTFGFIGIGILALVFLVACVLALVAQADLFTALGMRLFLLGLVVFIVMTAIGLHQRKRLKRYRAYDKAIQGRHLCMLDILASAIGRTPSYVAKDLKKIIRLGMFPNAHLDDEKTCIMLDYETYKQYLHTKEEAARQRRQEASQPGTPEDVQRALSEGRELIAKIREGNEAIPEKEISDKLTHLETITLTIFRYVEKHPEKLGDIRKMLTYYLPTTLKLVNAYREFYSQPLPGESVAEAKQDILSTLDTINAAFLTLAENLVQNDVLDVSTDISVLKTMLAQEGLTGNDFQPK